MIFDDLNRIAVICSKGEGVVNKTLFQYMMVSIMTEEKEQRDELTIRLCQEEEMKKLHLDFLGDDSHTDVMSFPYKDRPEELEHYLGDILVSIDKAQIVSEERGEPFEKELSLYCIHGLLHLLGYDDHLEMDKKVMRQKEAYYLTKLSWIWNRTGGLVNGS